jgi:hypothetical protein
MSHDSVIAVKVADANKGRTMHPMLVFLRTGMRLNSISPVCETVT